MLFTTVLYIEKKTYLKLYFIIQLLFRLTHEKDYLLFNKPG